MRVKGIKNLDYFALGIVLILPWLGPFYELRITRITRIVATATAPFLNYELRELREFCHHHGPFYVISDN